MTEFGPDRAKKRLLEEEEDASDDDELEIRFEGAQ